MSTQLLCFYSKIACLFHDYAIMLHQSEWLIGNISSGWYFLTSEYCRSQYYPEMRDPEGNSCKDVEFADVGCGFGGLLIRLATVYPDKLMLGMEIRDKVQSFSDPILWTLKTSSAQNKFAVQTSLR